MKRKNTLPNTMQALVKTARGAGHLRVKAVSVPRPRLGEVLVRVRAVGICGTDLHIMRNEYDHSVPLILGHEWSGEIAVVGKAVRGWKVGDHVIGELHTKACGVCRLCRSGNEQICRLKRPYGTYKPGALATYFRIPARLLHRMPKGLTFPEATFIEPTACVIQGYQRAGGVKKSDVVAVLGQGPIGLILGSYLSHGKKARRVYLTGRSSKSGRRLRLAKRLGIDRVIDVSKEDPVAVVMRETKDEGVDVVFEAAGTEAAVRQGIAMLRKDGKMGVLGLSKNDIAIPWNKVVMKDLDLIFSFSSGRKAWEEAVRAIAKGWIKPTMFITKVLPLREWREAFRMLEQGEAVKIVMTI